jgi:hypothetical protein
MREAAQLFVNYRRQLLERAVISLAPINKQLRDLVWPSPGNNRFFFAIHRHYFVRLPWVRCHGG